MQQQDVLSGLTTSTPGVRWRTAIAGLAAVIALGAAGEALAQAAAAPAPSAAPAVSNGSNAQAPSAPSAPSAPAAAAPAPVGDAVGLELNKLETVSNGCRAYLVVNNKSGSTYTALKLDLVMFQTDGVIGRRFALDLAPVKSGKTSVKLFDLDGVKCDDVGSLLINDIMDCKAGAGEEAGCLERLTVASRTRAQLSK